MSSSIRATAFGGHSALRLQRSLAQKNVRNGWPLELWIYAAGCVVLAGMLAGTIWRSETHRAVADHDSFMPPGAARVAADLPLPKENWKALSVAERAPDVAGNLASAGLPLQYQNRVPVAHLDGKDVNGKLPRIIWLKLDQPGNAMLVVDTDQGIFVKALEDAAPGFASPCRLDPYCFGTDKGEPAYFDRANIVVKSIWVIQDHAADAGRTPGWIAVTPPGENAAPPEIGPSDEVITTL